MLTRRSLLKLSGALATQSLWSERTFGLAEADPSRSGEKVAAVSSAWALLVRCLGKESENFHLEWIPRENGREAYELCARNGAVTVKGSSGVALARGIYSYLREDCGAMITWSGQHIERPLLLPDCSSRRQVCPYRFIQYYNPCTFGYSTAFWGWDRWQRELDWMALHGVTMPLAMDGQEAVWQRTWASFGVSDAEWGRFSTGPAHLPWHRMGNMNHYDGPLPQGWIDQKRDLQHKILERMVEFGMSPVVPAFAGHVPEAFKRLFPQAQIETLLWAPKLHPTLPRETKTFFLDPRENHLFREVGKRFIQEYRREFNVGSHYLADPFNELDVPIARGEKAATLKKFGKTVFDSIQDGDPAGTWVMQGWMFAMDRNFWDPEGTAAFLSDVPSDKMIILDIANDLETPVQGNAKLATTAWTRLDAFYGKCWINGMIHTFGGNNTVKGDLKLIAEQPASVLANVHHGNLVGWGMNMEGIESNEVVYELMTDVGWSAEKIDLEKWITRYCRARYGACSPKIKMAWELLLQSAYGSGAYKTKHAFQRRPSLEPSSWSVDSGATFQRATELFLDCWDMFGNRELYKNELIEFIVQAVGGKIDSALMTACAAHKTGRFPVRDEYAAKAVAMMYRIDALLDLRKDRRLTTWVEDARSWAKTPDEAAYYSSNAITLITFWGWSDLEDYAARLWSGLIRDYYAARWKLFFEALAENRDPVLDIWEQTWLSTPYRPSTPLPVQDLEREARAMLSETEEWRLV
jgi:alpha-N-acetylglucosaminidase